MKYVISAIIGAIAVLFGMLIGKRPIYNNGSGASSIGTGIDDSASGASSIANGIDNVAKRVTSASSQIDSALGILQTIRNRGTKKADDTID